MELLTYSRANSFKSCRRRHYFDYELRLKPMQDAKALRMGTAYHAGLETLKATLGLDAACQAARDSYRSVLVQDERELELEVQTVLGMLSGYQWRWADAGFNVIANEWQFDLPLVNPATGAESKLFRLAGKVDGIVRLHDGRLAVLEHKLLSDSLDSDSDLWRRLQLDHQVTLYIYAARQAGYDVATCLYDVGKKPTIKPTDVAVLDELGVKIVVDSNGNRVKTERNEWRQTADKAKGYTLLTRPMTPDEWAGKLVSDIGERPDYYFARREIPRLDQDIAECMAELWDVQKTLREAQREQRWYRTVTRDTCPFCAYFSICSAKWDVASGQYPEGFYISDSQHQELSNASAAPTPVQAGPAFEAQLPDANDPSF